MPSFLSPFCSAQAPQLLAWCYPQGGSSCVSQPNLTSPTQPWPSQTHPELCLPGDFKFTKLTAKISYDSEETLSREAAREQTQPLVHVSHHLRLRPRDSGHESEFPFVAFRLEPGVRHGMGKGCGVSCQGPCGEKAGQGKGRACPWLGTAREVFRGSDL